MSFGRVCGWVWLVRIRGRQHFCDGVCAVEVIGDGGAQVTARLRGMRSRSDVAGASQ